MVFLYISLLFLEICFVCEGHIQVNVHLIPHTHLDPMWKLKPDEYQKQVDKILGSAIPSMMENSNRSFAWESMHFLHNFLSKHGRSNMCESDLVQRTYTSVCISYQDAIDILLGRGQLEFVGGGWTAQDESLTSLFGSLDDLSTGRRYIAERFGREHLPTVGWFLDSFGHSSGSSGILAGLGYQGQVFNRIPYKIKRQLKRSGPAFFWYRIQRTAKEFHISDRPSSIPGGIGYGPDGLWTVVLPDHYSSPFPLKSVDAVTASSARGREGRQKMASYYYTTAQATLRYVSTLSTNGCEGEGRKRGSRTAHVLLLVGDDFSHRHADRSFRNLDGIVAAFNKQAKRIFRNGLSSSDKIYVMRYSTPSKYFQSCATLYRPEVNFFAASNDTTDTPSLLTKKHLRNQKVNDKNRLSVATGHLLPYSDNFVNDWTGFYGSRPLLKHRIRDLEDSLKSVEHIAIGMFTALPGALSGAARQHIYDMLLQVHKTLALGHHHDTITGTSRERVIREYILTLDDAQHTLDHLVGLMLRRDLSSLTKEQCHALLTAAAEVHVGTGLDFRERTISLSPLRQSIILLDMSLSFAPVGSSAQSDAAHSSGSREQRPQDAFTAYFRLNAVFESRGMCLSHRLPPSSSFTSSSYPALSVTYLPAIELLGEQNCTDTAPCDGMVARKSRRNKYIRGYDGGGGGNDVSEHAVGTIERILIAMRSPTDERDNRVATSLSVLTVSSCDNIYTGGSIRSSASEGMLSSRGTAHTVRERISATSLGNTNPADTKLLYDLAGALSLRSLHGGSGWHSSGAYLLRTPFNALLSGIASFSSGFGFSFLIFVLFLYFRPQSEAMLLRFKQYIYSFPHIKRVSKNCSLRSSVPSAPCPSTCTTLANLIHRLAPVLLVWISCKAIFLCTMLAWYYSQDSRVWVDPIIPFCSVSALIFSIPFLVGFLVQIWVSSVVYFSGAVVSSTATSPRRAVSRSPNKRTFYSNYHQHQSCLPFLRQHVCLFVFVLLVFAAMLSGFVLSFLFFPDSQTQPVTCKSPSPALHLLSTGNVSVVKRIPYFAVDGTASAHVVSIVSETDVSELTALLCSTLIRVRILKPLSESQSTSATAPITRVPWSYLEIDIQSRVPRIGTELFLRLDLDRLFATVNRDKMNGYEARTSDGWWQMDKKYDWTSPLSANFRPVSNSVTFTSSALDASKLAVVPAVEMSVSHPLGVALHGASVDISVHRSLRYDDEKGLQQPLRDSTRSHTTLKLAYYPEYVMTAADDSSSGQRQSPLERGETSGRKRKGDASDIDERKRSGSRTKGSGVGVTSTSQLIVYVKGLPMKYLQERLKSSLTGYRNILGSVLLNLFGDTVAADRVKQTSMAPGPAAGLVTLISATLMSVSEVCVVLAVPEQLRQLSYGIADNYLCTLDCLVCPWEFSSNFLLSHGLASFKMQISSSR